MMYAAIAYPPVGGVPSAHMIVSRPHSIALRHESDVQHGKRQEGKEERREHLARERGRARFEDDRLRVKGPEQVDGEMNERDQRRSKDPQDRRVPGPRARFGDGSPQEQIPYKEEEEKQRAGEPRVPGPPGAPDRLRPERSRGQHHARERRPHFGRCGGEPVVPVVLHQQVQNARKTDQAEREHRRPRGGHVDVENLLCPTLQALHGREPDGAHIHDPQEQEPQQGDPPASGLEGHSSTVAGKRSPARDTNTMSYARSNLSHPETSLKGRPARSREVTWTAPTSGGIRNGRSNTGSMSSANRTRITSADNSVPTATNPTVATAISAASGRRTWRIGTLKKSAKSGSPTASTSPTKTRFANSFPR